MDLAIDSANNFYVAGNTSVKLGETDPHQGGYDICLIKLDESLT